MRCFIYFKGFYYHYKKGYFDFERDGFGTVCTAENALLAEIEKCFDEDMKVSAEYRKRADKFFCLHDNKICARIFDAIRPIS